MERWSQRSLEQTSTYGWHISLNMKKKRKEEEEEEERKKERKLFNYY